MYSTTHYYNNRLTLWHYYMYNNRLTLWHYYMYNNRLTLWHYYMYNNRLTLWHYYNNRLTLWQEVAVVHWYLHWLNRVQSLSIDRLKVHTLPVYFQLIQAIVVVSEFTLGNLCGMSLTMHVKFTNNLGVRHNRNDTMQHKMFVLLLKAQKNNLSIVGNYNSQCMKFYPCTCTSYKNTCKWF